MALDESWAVWEDRRIPSSRDRPARQRAATVPTRVRRWFGAWPIVVAALLSTLFAVVVVEVLLRTGVVGPVRSIGKLLVVDRTNPLVSYHCYPSDLHGELDPLPDPMHADLRVYDFLLPPRALPIARLAEAPHCVRYRLVQTASRARLRLANGGEAPAPAPAPGVQRILGIGDSFAYGEGVPADRTVFAQLAGLLGPGYEVLNGAKPGLNTEEEVKVLDDLAAQYHARRAVVVFLLNDVVLAPELGKRLDFINDFINVREQYLRARESKAFWVGHLRLIDVVSSYATMARVRRSTTQLYLDSYDPAQNGDNLAALERDFRRLAGPGRRVALVLYPLMEGLERDYPFVSIHERVRAMAERAGLPVLDLWPAFRGQRTADLWVHPVDHHPNGKAHGIAARAVADWLRGIPGFLDRTAS